MTLPDRPRPFDVNREGRGAIILDEFGRPVGKAGLTIQIGDSPSIDSSGRLRVSTPNVLFDSKQLFGLEPQFWNQEITDISGEASVRYLEGQASTMLTVVAMGDTIVRQTNRRFNYQPGRGMIIEFTAIFGEAQPGTLKRGGYFSENDGLFFELREEVFRLGIRKNGEDRFIDQTNWNLDKMDGDGFSGIEIFTDLLQVFIIDFEWYGGGRIRFGFRIGGETIYCHEVDNANKIGSVYMANPNLPVRYELTSLGGETNLIQICTAVIAEGQQGPRGVALSGDLEDKKIKAMSQGTQYAVCGIRINEDFLASEVCLSEFSILTESNADFKWAVLFNPTLSNPLTFTKIDDSVVDFGVPALSPATGDIVSDEGFRVASGYTSKLTREALNDVKESLLKLGSNLSNVPDRFVLAVTPLANNLNFFGGLSWIEVR